MKAGLRIEDSVTREKGEGRREKGEGRREKGIYSSLFPLPWHLVFLACSYHE
jgi:hypothetical protein